MHDIGKNRHTGPNPADQEGWIGEDLRVMQSTRASGYDMLKTALPDICKWRSVALGHHEKIRRQRLPTGLRGEHISA